MNRELKKKERVRTDLKKIVEKEGLDKMLTRLNILCWPEAM